jgi:hypothetical protein
MSLKTIPKQSLMRSMMQPIDLQEVGNLIN